MPDNDHPEKWTIMKVIRWTADYLARKGVETPRLDAEVLLSDLLGLTRVELYLNFDRPLKSDELADYRHRVQRRAVREPVAYITGHKEFYSLDIQVSPEVLIPRPETELLVDEALFLVRERWPGTEDLKLCDLGTGSGAVALALASELKTACIWAVDVHPLALAVARKNAAGHGLEKRMEFVLGDLLQPFEGAALKFHLITANLPYVPRWAWADMPLDVRDYEPRLGLDGGEDGLDLIRRVVAQAREYLAPQGALLLEIWPTHGPEIVQLAAGFGYGRVKLVPDLAGRDRAAVLDTKESEV
ncbi:MAG: peptide chain release factor N(5)-glutamine methyltransferase [Pseudomonadota bacterium]